MITPAEAEAAIAAALPECAAETVELGRCAGRVLAEPVTAERDSPPFDRIAMDGIALAAADYANGLRQFRIAGVQAAGAPRQALAGAGTCLEAMTGAILPAGADAVIPVEQLARSGDLVTVPDSLRVTAGLNVHGRGSDARRGQRVLAAGARLGPPEIAILAAAGREAISLRRVPRIAVVSTGDELVDPGQPILEHQVRRSNPQAVAAALRLGGWGVCTGRHLPDEPGVMQQQIGALLAEHDVLVLSGGVSAGRFDHVPAVLGALGVRRVFHRIAQRPGQPLWFGVAPDGQPVFGLPGNPVSVLACLARYVLPALARMVGLPHRTRTVQLAAPLTFNPPLACLLPVALEYDAQGAAWAGARATRGSGDFHALAGADGIVELPPGPAVFERGTLAEFYPW